MSKRLRISLIVVTIGLSGAGLFALVRPTYTNSSCGYPHPIWNTLAGQIELYTIQHHGAPPEASRLWDQMTHPTNIAGDVGPDARSSEYPLGPYIQKPPANPDNGKAAVGVAPAPDVGWVYVVNGSDFALRQVNATGDGYAF
jgi:hypothetical protein